MTCLLCKREVEQSAVDRYDRADCELCGPAGITPTFRAIFCGRCSDQGADVELAVKQHAHIYHQRNTTTWCWDSTLPGRQG